MKTGSVTLATFTPVRRTRKAAFRKEDIRRALDVMFVGLGLLIALAGFFGEKITWIIATA